MTRLSMLPKIVSRDLRRAPSLIPDMECQLRIMSFVGERCAGHETRVMAHNPFSPLKGTSTKGCDTGMICACSACHDLLDGRDRRLQVVVQKYPMAFMEQVIRAEHATRAHLIGAGLIVVKDGEIA